MRGVNAWVALARERPPEEFALAGWKPEAWSADDLLSRTEAFTASGDALDEIFRARLIATVGAARARQLLPDVRTFDAPAGLDLAVVPDLVAEAIRRVGTPPFFLGLAAPVTEGTVRRTPDTLDPRADPDRARTLDHPSLRYFVHLNAPGWSVIGATAPWRPGVAVGHNDRLAWTAEPFDADTQDVYVEKLNPANPRQVEDNGRWVDIETLKGFIGVRARKTPVDFERETTRHGVIVAFDRARHLAFALRWSGTEPGTAAELGALGLDRATSPTAFREAAARWKMPARRITYTGVDGTRGSAIAALVPVRRGWSGAVPVPGGTGAAEWAGWMAPDPAASAAAVSPKVAATNLILESVHLHPDRGDALLQRLAALSSSRDSLLVQRAAIVDALADALPVRRLAAPELVLFAHPLAVTAAARRRFDVVAPAPRGAVLEPFAITFDTADWDRSTAAGAPGQSGSRTARTSPISRSCSRRARRSCSRSPTRRCRRTLRRR